MGLAEAVRADPAGADRAGEGPAGADLAADRPDPGQDLAQVVRTSDRRARAPMVLDRMASGRQVNDQQGGGQVRKVVVLVGPGLARSRRDPGQGVLDPLTRRDTRMAIETCRTDPGATPPTRAATHPGSVIGRSTAAARHSTAAARRSIGERGHPEGRAPGRVHHGQVSRLAATGLVRPSCATIEANLAAVPPSMAADRPTDPAPGLTAADRGHETNLVIGPGPRPHCPRPTCSVPTRSS